MHRLTNHLAKIPNRQKIRLFCGKWLTIKQVEQQGRPSGSGPLQNGGHSFQPLGVSVSTRASVIWTSWTSRQKRNTVLAELYFRLLCSHQILLKLPSSFQKDFFFVWKSIYTWTKLEGGKELMSITVS